MSKPLSPWRTASVGEDGAALSDARVAISVIAEFKKGGDAGMLSRAVAGAVLAATLVTGAAVSGCGATATIAGGWTPLRYGLNSMLLDIQVA